MKQHFEVLRTNGNGTAASFALSPSKGLSWPHHMGRSELIEGRKTNIILRPRAGAGLRMICA